MHYREKLINESIEDGILSLIADRELPYLTAIERWKNLLAKPNVFVVRYENLLSDFTNAFMKSIDSIGLSISVTDAHTLEKKYSFKNFSNREAGNEDTTSHYRKGIAGDWKNYFTHDIAIQFNKTYAGLCADLGNEEADLEGIATTHKPSTQVTQDQHPLSPDRAPGRGTGERSGV